MSFMLNYAAFGLNPEAQILGGGGRLEPLRPHEVGAYGTCTLPSDKINHLLTTFHNYWSVCELTTTITTKKQRFMLIHENDDNKLRTEQT